MAKYNFFPFFLRSTRRLTLYTCNTCNCVCLVVEFNIFSLPRGHVWCSDDQKKTWKTEMIWDFSAFIWVSIQNPNRIRHRSDFGLGSQLRTLISWWFVAWVYIQNLARFSTWLQERHEIDEISDWVHGTSNFNWWIINVNNTLNLKSFPKISCWIWFDFYCLCVCSFKFTFIQLFN